MPTYAEIHHFQQLADMYIGRALLFLAVCFGFWLAGRIIGVIIGRCACWAFARLTALSRRAWRSFMLPACRRWAESFLAWSSSL